MSAGIALREVRDLAELMAWRAEVIRNVFGVEADAGLLECNRQYYQRHVADGTHIALVAAYCGSDAGCGAICITDELPSPDNPGGRCAYVMNVYVRRPYRSRGVAHAIVRALVAKARRLRCGKIYLESTGEARSLYRTSGFADMKNMMQYGYDEI